MHTAEGERESEQASESVMRLYSNAQVKINRITK